MTLAACLTAAPDSHAVTFSFQVTNGDTEPVELTFTSSQVAEVTVTPVGADEPVWRWGAGRAFGQAIRTEQLGPGETLEQSVVWDEPTPGIHEVVGRLAADNGVRAETTVEL
jgi:hypothetical protein